MSVTNDDQYLFKNYRIVKMLGRVASEADLVKWKHVNSDLYVILGPIHMKTGHKALSLDESETKYWTLVCQSKLEQTAEDWKPEFASSYHTLYLTTLAIFDKHLDEPRPKFEFVSSLVEQVRPYITTVELQQIDISELGAGKITAPVARRLAEFFNRFPNLQSFEIRCISTRWYSDEFDIFFQTLRSDIEVTICLSSWEIDHGRAHTMLKNWTQNQLYNILVWDLKHNQTICDQTRLQSFVTLCMNPDYADQIEDLTLNIHLKEGQGFFPNKEDVVACLTQLSPKIRKLKLYDETNWNVLNGVPDWGHLESLYIYGQTGPLDFLKTCTQLEILAIHLNEKTSIFHDNNRSYNDALREYFSNLQNLNTLTFMSGEPEWYFEIEDGSELEQFIQTLLPEDVEILYGHYTPMDFIDLDVSPQIPRCKKGYDL